mgnify:CR=1 FL=1
MIVALCSLGLASCGGSSEVTTPASMVRSIPGTSQAPAELADACRRAAEQVSIAVLCPRLLPEGGFEVPREYGNGPCTYLLNLEPRGMNQRPGSVFHLLIGGTCRPWNLTAPDGRWPEQPNFPDDRDLRLIGKTSLDPEQPQEPARRVRLDVIRRTRVGSAPALVLRNPAYPVGGIHGGHLTVVWNHAGSGFAVSGHPVGLDTTRSDPARHAIVARASRTLLGVAASMGPARSGIRRGN